ncbi:MAG TPA: phospholipid carrier-dependent glycosyltransferase [Solirubrobacterales bacterium]|nr:phospholipid carrier-dependent glycosyltransferase [Solirubrobacterales bacterium]
MVDRARVWLRSLPERHGRTTLLLLVGILILGFGLRAYRVVEPLPTPGDDSRAYYALAKALYEEGSYGGPSFDDSSDWSPGAPLIYAASFYATGGAREGTARIVELFFGLAAIVVVYLLGRRVNCRPTGLLAAFAVAVYPPFIHSTGALFSEPPAIFTLPAAVLAFLWASEPTPTGSARGSCRGAGGPAGEVYVLDPPAPRHPRVRWVLPGLLFGATALIRPEYLLVGVAFVGLAFVWGWRERGWKPGLASAVLLAVGLLLPIVPWAVRNQVVLDRTVPISTGGGKALYVGTLLPADGEYQRAKALLVRRYFNRDLAPGSAALDRIDPTPLFDNVAARYPELPRDQALGKIGRQNLFHYLGEDPVGYAEMTVRKVWRMWSGGVGEAMNSTAGRVVQTLIVALAIAGLGVLAWRRRWWVLAAMATPLVLVTAVGAASLAASRRNEVLMTLIFPLAAAALSRGTAALLSSRKCSPEQASSPSS